MATYRTIRMDENMLNDRPITTKLAAIKKDALSTAIPRRPALGDLVNRPTKPAAVGLKKASTVDSEQNVPAAPIVDMKKVKPRVDTHWAGAMPIRKLTRSNSVKTTTTTVGATAVAGPRLVKARTSTMASVQGVKYTAPAVPRAKSPERAINVLRRQESTLNRKSLTKVKASSDGETTSSRVKIESIKPAIKMEIKVETSSHSQKLLHQFNDIDAGDDFNPLLVSEYVNDIYSYLNHLETIYAIRKNHLDGQRDVFPKMRAVLMDWINEVHLQYRFAQETFHMAVSIIDRYLQIEPNTRKQHLQLVGVTALFISSKYEELYPPEVKDFVYITDDTYTKNQVLEMEKEILKKLNFELGCPLTIHFLRRFSKAAKSSAETHIMSKYFLELCTVDYNMCQYLPSEVAAASLFISLYIANRAKSISPKSTSTTIWSPTLQYYSTYNLVHLKPIIASLADLVINAPKAKLNNVYTKYTATKLSSIAIKTEKCASLLQELAAGKL